MNYVQLSKEISYALRHAPWEYELELDEEGWVNVKNLLTALNEEKRWNNVTYLWILKQLLKLGRGMMLSL